MISRTLKNIMAFGVVLTLTACAHGELMRQLSPGMSATEVTAILGNPDGVQQRGDRTVHKYTNRLVESDSKDRADWFVIYEDGKLVEYGAGEVRVKDETIIYVD